MSDLTQWLELKALGFTDAGAAGTQGNFKMESSGFPQRLQGDHSVGYAKSIEYTAAADRGELDQSFKGGAGYGLCQWGGGSRKYALLLLY